jgi:hypothetical protein
MGRRFRLSITGLKNQEKYRHRKIVLTVMKSHDILIKTLFHHVMIYNMSTIKILKSQDYSCEKML